MYRTVSKSVPEPQVVAVRELTAEVSRYSKTFSGPLVVLLPQEAVLWRSTPPGGFTQLEPDIPPQVFPVAILELVISVTITLGWLGAGTQSSFSSGSARSVHPGSAG
jgi:hypothetical protein